jgi:hypothetical protein
VVLSADGWLFYTDDGAIEDYANEQALSVGELRAWPEAGRRTREWLHAQGIVYVFTVAPDKHAIDPELVPPTIRRLGGVSRTDQVLATLAGERVVAVDLRPSLHEAKTRERIYHATDTHWNGRGAWVAYVELIDAIRASVPAVPPPWPRSDFDAVSRKIAGQDLARMSGLARILREKDLDLVPRRLRRARVVEPSGAATSTEVGRLVTEIPGSTLPRALVFRDSFTSALAPFLSEHFSRAVYLWRSDVDAAAVLQERPDVVVHEIVGRHLYSFIPAPNLIPQ